MTDKKVYRRDMPMNYWLHPHSSLPGGIAKNLPSCGGREEKGLLSENCIATQPPPSFSRQPPDGHEFPSHYEETVKSTKEDTRLPKEKKPVAVSNSIRNLEETFKRISTSHVNIYKHRGWRNDEKSEKSVKDKIAMFSLASTNCQPNIIPPKKLARFNSSDDVNSTSDSYKHNLYKDDRTKMSYHTPSTMKKGSLAYNSMVDVSSDHNVESEDFVPNKTQSTLDLASATSFPYEPASLVKDYSTLPRKLDIGRKPFADPNSETRAYLSRTVSFTGPTKIHTRSQSLIDIGSKPANILRPSIDDARKSSLNVLIEQRRKSISKLRGLVIPEKLSEIPTPQYAIDLPEIKSKDCPLSSPNLNQEKSVTNSDKVIPPSTKNKSSCLMTTPPWKVDGQFYELPKYSPAFKRKSLSVYGPSSSVSSVSSSLNSSREELRNFFNEPFKSNPQLLLSQNTQTKNTLTPPQSQTEPKSIESITSSISELGLDGRSDPNSPNVKPSNENSVRAKSNKESTTQKMNADMRLAEEESDNDSTVSSSRSTISLGFSPPSSPLPEMLKCDKGTVLLSRSDSNSSGGRVLRRTLSSETTASTSSNGSTLTSGSQASCSSICSSLSADSRRVLKPQSVEAINRKNVLSSARYSCGQDLKVGSPPMQAVKTECNPTNASTNDINKHLTDNNNSSNGNVSCHVLMYQDDCKEPIANTEVDSLDIKSKYWLPPEIVSENKDKLITKPIKENHCDCSTMFDDSPDSSESINAVQYKCKYADEMDNNSPQPNETLCTDLTGSPNSNIAWESNECSKNIVKPDSDPINTKNGTSRQVKIKNMSSKSASPQKSVSVSDIKKAFEKAEQALIGNGRSRNSNTTLYHNRVSSVDSTNSDDSYLHTPTHYSSSSDLQKEQQFGSITSLASSTSLISQQELSQLIEDSNHVLEESGCSHEVEVVILHRDTTGSSVGIILAGGADCEAKEITVHKVLTGSPADKDGRIQKGDWIFSINGKSMKGLTHHESLAILKAPRPEVVLVVSRYRSELTEDSTPQFMMSQRHPRIPEHKINQLPSGRACEGQWGPVITVMVTKDGAGLGFSVEGGKDSPFGDQPLTIKKIFTGGCAEKCGQLFAGDELLSVNNTDLNGLSRIEAWALMKRIPDGKINLNIRHPAT